MIGLQNKIKSIRQLLFQIGESLDNLTFDSFDIVFPKALAAIKKVHHLRSEAIVEFGNDSTKMLEKELFTKAKQIENKFDNIVKVFLDEEKKLEKELASTLQKKKLTVYQKV